MADVKSTPGLKPEHFDDDQLGRFQTALANATQPSRDCVLIGGALVKAVAIPASGQVEVSHTLGRAWRGWFLTNTNTAGVGVAASSTQTDTSKYLSLTGTGAATVDVWVF